MFKPLIPEIGPLERSVVSNLGVEEMVRRLDRQAEALDEEIQYSYERSTSRRITRLTIVVVTLTVVTIALGVFQMILAV